MMAELPYVFIRRGEIVGCKQFEGGSAARDYARSIDAIALTIIASHSINEYAQHMTMEWIEDAETSTSSDDGTEAEGCGTEHQNFGFREGDYEISDGTGGSTEGNGTRKD